MSTVIIAVNFNSFFVTGDGRIIWVNWVLHYIGAVGRGGSVDSLGSGLILIGPISVNLLITHECTLSFKLSSARKGSDLNLGSMKIAIDRIFLL